MIISIKYLETFQSKTIDKISLGIIYFVFDIKPNKVFFDILFNENYGNISCNLN